MKLPYTPVQSAARHAEEDGRARGRPRRDAGRLLLRCTASSRRSAPRSPASGSPTSSSAGGALPVALSDTVRVLKERGSDRTSRSQSAPVFGGDVDCVTPWSALAWVAGQRLRRRRLRDRTGDRRHRDSPSATAGWRRRSPRTRPRRSAAGRSSRCGSPRPTRERHRGVSHHTQAVLAALPRRRDRRREGDGEGWREACDGLPLAHMGRGPDEDPAFFASAYGAGRLARALVAEVKSGRP